MEERLSLLTRACREKRQITFFYDHYEADGKRHHELSPTGEELLYRLHPFYLLSADDRYCLLGNVDGREELSAFFVDLMDEITLLDEPARTQKSLESRASQVKPSDFLAVSRDWYVGEQEL